MKTWFRNITALSLLFAYSLSLSISVQNYLIDTVLKTEKNHHVSSKTAEFKTPEINLFPNLEPLGDVVNGIVSHLDVLGVKTSYSPSKQVELYTLTKDNQYLNKSKNIQPGLDIETLLYPFHTFS